MNAVRVVAMALALVPMLVSAQTAGTPWLTPTVAEVDAVYADSESLYIDLHRNPELAFQETQTAGKLAARMRAPGFEVTTGVGGTGVVAVLRNGPGPTVMLRTEMDALPIVEKTGLPFASTVTSKTAEGLTTPVMHAGGHDLHMAAWVGTTVVARETSPTDPVVVTVGSIHGGTAGNVIPDEVRLQLSVRTYTPEVRTRTLAAIRRIAKGEALAAGAAREPQVDAPAKGNALVFNNPATTVRLATALRKGLGDDKVVEMPQKMTSEDFAEYGLAGVPSVLLHIGAVDPARLAAARQEGVPVPAPHSPEWVPALEPTLKGAIRAEVTALLELLRGN